MSKMTIIKYENWGYITVCFDDDVAQAVQTLFRLTLYAPFPKKPIPQANLKYGF